MQVAVSGERTCKPRRSGARDEEGHHIVCGARAAHRSPCLLHRIPYALSRSVSCWSIPLLLICAPHASTRRLLGDTGTLQVS